MFLEKAVYLIKNKGTTPNNLIQSHNLRIKKSWPNWPPFFPGQFKVKKPQYTGQYSNDNLVKTKILFMFFNAHFIPNSR